MAGYVFVGRRRHPVKVLVYQLLTLGIYGRVYLYKTLREFDGHEALFLDRRPYIPLLILPFVGPLFVKRKIIALLDDLVHHDVTTPPYTRRRLFWEALVPLIPFFHLHLNKLLSHHWSQHTKEEELEIKRAHLAQLQRSKSAESVAAARVLEKEIAQRAKELDDLQKAALALREAEEVRRQAERSMGRRGPAALVRKLGAAAASRLPTRKGSAALEEPEEEEAPAKPPKGTKAKPVAESEEETAEPTKGAKADEPEPVTSESEAAPKRSWKSLLPFGKKDGDAAEPKGKGSKAKPEGPTREERKEAKRKAKEAKRAAKEKAKQDKLRAKEKAKAKKAAAKEAKKAAKAAAKEEAKKEKAAGKKAAAKKPPAKGGKKQTSSKRR